MYSVHPSKIRAEPGNRIELQCNLKPSVKWYHKITLQNTDHPLYKFSGILSTESKLKIDSINKSHNGEYYCVSGNSYSLSKVYIYGE